MVAELRERHVEVVAVVVEDSNNGSMQVTVSPCLCMRCAALEWS